MSNLMERSWALKVTLHILRAAFGMVSYAVLSTVPVSAGKEQNTPLAGLWEVLSSTCCSINCALLIKGEYF